MCVLTVSKDYFWYFVRKFDELEIVMSFQAAAESMDLVLDMIPAGHALEPYLPLLKLDGALVMVGVVTEPLQFASPLLMIGMHFSFPTSFTYFHGVISINPSFKSS